MGLGTCALELPAAAAAAAAATAAAVAGVLAQVYASQLVPSFADLALAGLALLAVTPQHLARNPEEAAGGRSQRKPQRAVPLQLPQTP